MQGERNGVIVSKQQKLMRCLLRMPHPLSPESNYLITIDIIIIIVLADLMNQPVTTGPTSISTSTSDNLNKEKKREGISKRQKRIGFMMGIYRSCG
jgi:hypothetical protein